MTNGTEGVTVSGADALLVIGLVALALAFGAFVIVLRRFPPAPGGRNTDQLAEQRQASRGASVQARAQAQAEAEQIRARAQADADRILGRAAEAAEQAAQQAAERPPRGRGRDPRRQGRDASAPR